MIDGFGREIDYLRVSLTDRCNLRCIYCMPEEGVKSISHDEILRLEEFERVIEVAASMGIKSIRLTGGEPLIRKNIVGFIDHISKIDGIENVSLTTNGILLPMMAADLKAAGLDRVNISLDTLDPEQYKMITRCGKIEDVLAGIEAAFDNGFDPVKVNVVTVKRLNQDLFEFAKMSIDRPLHMRFIEYMPVGSSGNVDGLGWDESDVIPSEQALAAINAASVAAGMSELEPVGEGDGPIGWGPARYYKYPEALGTVGFISAMSNHFCKKCNRLRLTADGKLRPCLFSDKEIDLRSVVRGGTDDDIRDAFKLAVGDKPDGHNGKIGTDRKMSMIGG